MNKSGTGYYTIFPGATGGAVLYYYSVGAGTWTTITQSFLNRSGTNIANITSPLNSGDMAFDGSGNLWMVCSNAANYALYKISAPVPTTVTASILVDTIIAQKATPNGASITGIAFNSAGKLYLSTGAGAAAGNNKLYELSTTTGTLTLKGNLLAGYGDDLTSCTFPPGVLPVVWIDFAAAFQTNAVQLVWTANENENVTGYTVEFSTDGEHWQDIDHIDKHSSNGSTLNSYRYFHREFIPGNNYYRIIQVSATGEETSSSVKFVNTKANRSIYLGPNPAKDIIYIYNRNNIVKYIAQVFDKNGQLIWSTVVAPDQQSINISHLKRGSYVLRLLSGAINENSSGFQFIKW
jgi:hypothetical protein